MIGDRQLLRIEVGGTATAGEHMLTFVFQQQEGSTEEETLKLWFPAGSTAGYVEAMLCQAWRKVMAGNKQEA